VGWRDNFATLNGVADGKGGLRVVNHPQRKHMVRRKAVRPSPTGLFRHADVGRGTTGAFSV
jgi:hypothetical protein